MRFKTCPDCGVFHVVHRCPEDRINRMRALLQEAWEVIGFSLHMLDTTSPHSKLRDKIGKELQNP